MRILNNFKELAFDLYCENKITEKLDSLIRFPIVWATPRIIHLSIIVKYSCIKHTKHWRIIITEHVSTFQSLYLN